MRHLCQIWSRSRVFRIVVVVSIAYVLLRLAAHGVFLAQLLSQGTQGYDLQVYLDAADRFRQRQDLYPQGLADVIEFYQYSPAFALALTPWLRVPMAVTMAVLSLLHSAAYGLLYWRWGQIFDRLNLERASRVWAWSLPLWLVFSKFWSDLAYLNVYIFMALLATLLIEAILDERLGWAVFWLTVVLQIKPQWAFAAVVPLLLGRYRFSFRLVALSLAAYAALIGLTMFLAGPSYGWQQYVEYVQLLWRTGSGAYLWRSPNAPFLGYNHSIQQIVVYLLGITPGALRLGTALKALILIPLAVVGGRLVLHPPRQVGRDVVQLSLGLSLVLYLAAFIWLDVVWEATLSIVVFIYLLAIVEECWARIWTWGVFLPYALLDLWQLISFAIWGMTIVAPGPYILTDPSIYVPWVMIVITSFYALLIKQLFKLSNHQVTAR